MHTFTYKNPLYEVYASRLIFRMLGFDRHALLIYSSVKKDFIGINKNIYNSASNYLINNS